MGRHVRSLTLCMPPLKYWEYLAIWLNEEIFGPVRVRDVASRAMYASAYILRMLTVVVWLNEEIFGPPREVVNAVYAPALMVYRCFLDFVRRHLTGNFNFEW